MVTEQPIVVDTREDLLYLLGEACEIEHNLMCCYLYAAWSLKRDEADGLTPQETAAVKGWRGAITSVAIEEMAHLALASNLMVAIGGAPHLVRPNFPVAPGYHPSGIVVELARFGAETLDHFIYLERPEGVDLPDPGAFAHTARYSRAKRAGALMPSSQDYATVGHLYRGIRDGFTQLAGSLGEERLFCGPSYTQLSKSDVSLPGLDAVTGLASALKAIDTIVDQGEGSPGHTEDSHYQRFLAIKREFEALRKANVSFTPAFPVAHNPVMRRPVNPVDRIHIDDPNAAPALDVANALYGAMLRCLAQCYGRPEREAATKALLIDAAIDAMTQMTLVAEHLARLPAGPQHPGIHAGMTFTMLRDVGRMPRGTGEMLFLNERFQQIGERAAALFGAGHPLQLLPPRIKSLAGRFAIAPRKAAPAPQEKPMTQAPSNDAPEIAEGQEITVSFNAKRCIHARFCVLGAPKVFKANTPGEWIFPDQMRIERLIAVAHACPSGAITYARKDSGPEEDAPPVNLVRLRENGPLAIHAPMTLGGQAIGFRATLCRCGASKNKPYCDGSHNDIKFEASGEPATKPSEALAVRDGVVDVQPMRNGPLSVTGNLEILSGTGRTINRVTSAKLCRCGGSANKPYCDGTHTRIGFEAE
jgi:CDGSH-type Zn-finger protein/uncharacterized Fe-S cluster protein YjdI